MVDFGALKGQTQTVEAEYDGETVLITHRIASARVHRDIEKMTEAYYWDDVPQFDKDDKPILGKDGEQVTKRTKLVKQPEYLTAMVVELQSGENKFTPDLDYWLDCDSKLADAVFSAVIDGLSVPKSQANSITDFSKKVTDAA